MANFEPLSSKKRGRQPTKLSVKLFLLDPEKKTTKVTKETCSKEMIPQLMREGYGPPQSEHCTSDDKEKVEFLFELTNEQFKQKLNEIYPKLENSCFVFMKADKNNKLEEINPGRCCYRCYTPENVYHSERGQGRLYIQKITENQISQCTHGVSLMKRLRSSQQRFVPILPKKLPSGSTITSIGTESSGSVTTSVAMPTLDQLLDWRTILNNSGATPVLDLSSSSIAFESSLPANSAVNVTTQSHLQTPTIFSSTPPANSFLDMITQGNVSSSNFLSSDNITAQNQLLTSTIVSVDALRPSTSASRAIVTQGQLQTSTIVSPIESTPPAHSSINMATSQIPPSTSTLSRSESVPPCNSSIAVATGSYLPLSTSGVSQMEVAPLVNNSLGFVTPSQLQKTTSVPTNQTALPVYNILSQSLLPSTTVSELRPPVNRSSNMPSQYHLSTPTVFSQLRSTPPVRSSVNMLNEGQLPTSVVSATIVPPNQFSRTVRVPDTNFEPAIVATSIHAASLNRASYTTVGQDFAQVVAPFNTGAWLPMESTTGLTHGNLNTIMWQQQQTREREVRGLYDRNMVFNLGVTSSQPLSRPVTQLSAVPAVDIRIQSPRLYDLADIASQREQPGEWSTINRNSSNVQSNVNLPESNKLSIPAFLEKAEETRKLEISMDVLHNDDLLQKLKDSTMNILTIEIQSRCELQEVVKHYSLPSCLKTILIHNNYLNCQDVFALCSSLTCVNGLHELDLSGTKFEENSFFAFISVLIKCSELRKFCLTSNYLTEQERTCLPAAFGSMKNLKYVNLSESSLTVPQASNILERLRQLKDMVCLDLSRNPLQGNEIVSGICQLQSLEELNLSHTNIRFYPLPNLEQQHDKLPINTKSISVSSNNMTPKDIVSFVTLIKSELLKIILDFNHVGNSIWALCSLNIKHLKVLGLANTYICGPAIEGLAFLLTLAEELEELDLSCNNLMLNDFQELQSSLSNLTQLKKLNLSNNPGGTGVVLEKTLALFKHLGELRLSGMRLNGQDLCKIASSLASLKSLSYLDLSNNAIGPEGAKALAEVLKEFSLLETLDLNRSCMKEDDTSILCTSITSLKNLKHLDLSGNRIDIEVLHGVLLLPSSLEAVIFSDIIHGEKLFTCMKKLQRLRNLHLSKINVRPCDVDAFVSMLSSFPSLEQLTLTDIHVPGCKWEQVFSAMSLKNMKKLHLSGLKLLDEEALFGMLSSLSCLEELVFSDIDLVRMAGFFAALESLSCLKILDLHSERTKISEIDAEDLVRVLPSLQKLEKLALSVSQFDGNQEQLFKAVKKLRYLKKLTLFDLGLNKNSTDALAAALTSLPLLERLTLANGSDSEHLEQLFDALGKLRYLKILTLFDLSLNKNSTDALAAALLSLQLLEKLKLERIIFCIGDLEQLFDAVGKLRYLEKLKLSHTRLNQTSTDALAAALTSLQLLERLKLRVNFDSEHLEQLFDAVGKLRYLKKLTLFNLKLNKNSTDALATALPSLLLLEELRLPFVSLEHESAKQLFTSVQSLRFLMILRLTFTEITQSDAETLINVLLTLPHLRRIYLPGVKCDHKESYEEYRERQITFKNRVKEELPGLLILN